MTRRSHTNLPLAALLALALVACSGETTDTPPDAAGPHDAGSGAIDAGEEPVDAGEEPVDAGTPVDAGEEPVDAGPPKAWEKVESGTDKLLMGAWGARKDALWVVGSGTTILRWNGAAFATEPAPAGLSTTLVEVFGTGTDELFASGLSNAPLLHRVNGRWETVENPTGKSLYGYTKAGSELWGAGKDGAIRRWDGAAWGVVASPSTEWLWGAWGANEDDIWFVGLAGTVLRWNGREVQAVAGVTTNGLWGVSGSAADDVWAAGANGTVVHGDGVRWSAVPTGTTENFHAIWARAGEAWAVGNKGIVVRCASSACERVDLPVTDKDLWGVWGVDDELWVTGGGGTLYRRGL